MTGLLVAPAALFQRLMNWKIRGVRWVEIIGTVAVAVMILSVYVAKTAAARENARIGEIEREIAAQRQRVRLLRAEAARLEQPGRLESLSRQAGLEPVDVHRLGDQSHLAGIGGKAPEKDPEKTPEAALEPAAAATTGTGPEVVQ